MGTRGDTYPLAVLAPPGTSESCSNHLSHVPNTKCVNSTHSTCRDGYQPSGNPIFSDLTATCDDIDECLGPSRADCGPHTHCNNMPGSYYCSCIDGYESSSGKATFRSARENTCRDIDECLGPSRADCGPHTHCTNMPGNYSCSCIDGYESSSGKATFRSASENTCRDIDECLGPSQAHCGPHAHCTNAPGSYYCSCIDGYESSSGKATFRRASENTCRDIDECLGPSRADCGPNAHCTNMPGSYSCSCIDGYKSSSGKATFRGTSESICQDIDKCKSYNLNNCSPSAECINTEGSYRCECWPGYSRLTNTECTELTCTPRLDDNAIKAQVGRVCEKLKSMKALDTASRKAALQEILNTVEELLTGVGLQNRSMEQRHNMVTEAMATVEKLLRTLTLALPDGMTGITATNGTELGLAIKRAGYQSQEAVTLLQSKTQMELNWAVAPGQKIEGFTLTGLLTYQGLSSVLEGAAQVEGPEWNEISQAGKQKWEEEPGQASYRVLSPVVSAFTNAPHTPAFNLSISFCFSHPEPESKDELRLLCAYWEPNTMHWSTDGCTRLESNATSTRCQCNHLSSFAILMAFYELEDWTLDVITKVGLVISLVCLLLSILTFLFCRALKGRRTIIHLHLCLALFVADAVFLLGASSTSNKVLCSVVAGLLHYFFLAAFCWMCLEGAQLYLMVVKVFPPHGLKRRYMFLLGYGLPALVVGISAATYSEGYGTARHCWLSLERGFRWSLLAPVCTIIVINIIIIMVTVWKLSQKFTDSNPDMSLLRKLRVFTVTAIAQLCILAVPWIFGIFQFNQRSLALSYVVTVLISCQGLFVFLLHCLLQKQVRDEYRRWLHCSCLQKSSKFSSSTANTRQELQRSQESSV
ncbi:adhesion G protein-coupled receptor E5 [Emydura macquarii macquarii]|uniref:adhesion G protein-coupled receptor E5 n=1 Tax=Emydura macquarii macquarii TaxID=1129001 RepID=UPI00352BADA1